MDARLTELKAVLFDILGSMCVPSDVQAVQQMGVSLSSAVKREGVVIIQNQNVEVLARLVPAVVRALRLCDMISQAQPIRQIEYGMSVPQQPTDEVVVRGDEGDVRQGEVVRDPIEVACAWLYDRKTPWKKMQGMMKAAYLSYVLARLPTGVAAAKLLGVGPAYLSKVRKPITNEEVAA